MKQKTIHILSFIFFLFLTSRGLLVAQSPDPYELIDSLKNKLEQIYDYSADIEIEVDVDFINMPVKHAKIFYKQPDKIKFKSDEFIMLPKKGFNNQLMTILNEPYNAIYIGEEVMNNRKQHILKIIPLGKKPRVVLATWWIDQKTFLLTKTESNTRDEGTFNVEFDYEGNSILPAEMRFSFEIENINIPMKFIGKAAGVDKEKLNSEGPKAGKVYIRFTNYQLNQKIEDDFFNEEIPE
ncbi:MAG: outer membrane lipoprotein-sorting protein [Bacteroidales bacterium]|nr:outer membrane lipoprotein-sorting protein [Bacteroidales bacterium]MCF8405667.1 outer membrane lipoprotein-sorting protein [Bacteroidales bacterium]